MLTITGSFVLLFSSIISSAGGVGGGTLNVPILINFGGFSYDEAVILSLCTLLGNYCSQVIINVKKINPIHPEKPLIYWDAVLVLLPAELAGSNIGVILLAIFPSTILYILALFVLIIAGKLTIDKAMSLYSEEIQYHDDYAMEVEETHALLGTNIKQPKIYQDDSIFLIQVIVGIWLFYALCYTLLHFVSICSFSYILVLILIFILLICEIIWGVNYLMKKQQLSASRLTQSSSSSVLSSSSQQLPLTSSPLQPSQQSQQTIQQSSQQSSQPISPINIPSDEINWQYHSLYLPILTFGIGNLTALLGIGGGELVGPMLLKLGIHPVISSATTSTMSLLNTSSSIVHYFFYNEISFIDGIHVMIIGSLGGLIGRSTALWINTKYRASSFIVFALFGIIVLSFILYINYLIVFSPSFSFDSLCSLEE